MASNKSKKVHNLSRLLIKQAFTFGELYTYETNILWNGYFIKLSPKIIYRERERESERECVRDLKNL